MADLPPQAARAQLATRLLAHVLPLAGTVLDRMQTELEAYRDLDRADLLPIAVAGVTRVLAAIGDNRPFTDAELATFREQGELRGRQGISMEEMLTGWRLAVRAALDSLITIGREEAIPDRDLLDLSHDVLAVSDAAVVALAGGHREGERELAGYEQDRLADLVRAILLGTLTRAELRVRTEGYRLDPDGQYYTFCARSITARPTGDIPRRTGANTRGLTAMIDGNLAGFLDQRPEAMTDGVVGVGPAAPLDRLEPSFRRANRAMITAAAFGLTGVHDLSELGLLPAVLADHEIGDELVHRYLTPLGAGEAAETIIETVRHYLGQGMRADLTADLLFVHHNTVRYRVRRFEELTATSLRDPDRALEAWWALQRHRLTGPR